MERDIVSVKVDDDKEEVANVVKKYDLGTWVNVIISIGAALILGNLII